MKYVIAIALVLLMVLVFAAGMATEAVMAAESDAKEADPVVVPCKKINTATEGDFVISIFLCKPENAAPYKMNTMGMMLPESQ